MLKQQSSINELFYWQNSNSTDTADDDQTSTTLSVSLLLKHRLEEKSSKKCHSSAEICSCHRSFHLFCTDFLRTDSDPSSLSMIHIHPAPRHHDRNARRTMLYSAKKRKSRTREEFDQDSQLTITATATLQSDSAQLSLADNQSLEKKLPIPLRSTTRTTSLNVPNPVSSASNACLPLYRAFPMPSKPTPNNANRQIKASRSFSQLQIRAQSVFDQSSIFFPSYLPRGPPPSPKTPTQDPTFLIQPSINTNPFRAMSIIPRRKYSIKGESTESTGPTVKAGNYEDHAREYLSPSDCSDSEDENDQTKVKKEKDQSSCKDQSQAKSKTSTRTHSLSRSDAATRDRLVFNHPNHYLSLAEVYYSSLDVYKNLNKRSRPTTRAQIRSTAPISNDQDETATNTSRTTKTNGTSKNNDSATPVKSLFGFSKTASSMHFGHAAGRLSLQSSFEKWPQPASRRTPIERKQEVTTLRLVTLPLVTS